MDRTARAGFRRRAELLIDGARAVVRRHRTRAMTLADAIGVRGDEHDERRRLTAAGDRMRRVVKISWRRRFAWSDRRGSRRYADARDGASVHAVEPVSRGHPRGRCAGAVPAPEPARRRVVRGLRRVAAVPAERAVRAHRCGAPARRPAAVAVVVAHLRGARDATRCSSPPVSCRTSCRCSSSAASCTAPFPGGSCCPRCSLVHALSVVAVYIGRFMRREQLGRRVRAPRRARLARARSARRRRWPCSS